MPTMTSWSPTGTPYLEFVWRKPEFLIGDACNRSQCEADNVTSWNCDVGNKTLNSSTVCSYGCNRDSGECYEEFELGAMCNSSTSHICDLGEEVDRLWTCSAAGRLVNYTPCSFTCNDHGQHRCFDEFEIGSSCDLTGNRCGDDDLTLWICDVEDQITLSRLNDSEVCPYVCLEGSCFEEFELGSSCTQSKCEDDSTLWICSDDTGILVASWSCSDQNVCSGGDCVVDLSNSGGGEVLSPGEIVGYSSLGILAVFCAVVVILNVVVCLLVVSRRKKVIGVVRSHPSDGGQNGLELKQIQAEEVDQKERSSSSSSSSTDDE